MAKYLIVEDSPVILKVMRHIARQELGGDTVFAASMAEAVALFDEHKESLVAAVVDLTLPDAPDGELVAYLLEKKFPVVVLTGSGDAQRRKRLLKMGVADYVIKENRFSYQYAVRMLARLDKNRSTGVLVVDDSVTARHSISDLLRLHLYRVFEAENGREALEVLQRESGIQLVITDYHMPEMDGTELIVQIRRQFENRLMSIIGLSAHGADELSVRFIKNGADDFLQKPFVPEEFFCRITNNVESLERLTKLREQATRDYLTGLYNRRYFMEEGGRILSRQMRESKPCCVAVMDIDHFKHINDEYGHDAGDAVLTHFSRYLSHCFSAFLVARTGGEEFCAVLPGFSLERASHFLDEFRAQVAAKIIDLSDEDYERISISIGVTQISSDSLNLAMKRADLCLYRAKEGGRNLVVTDEGD